MNDVLSSPGLLLCCPGCAFLTQQFTKLISHVVAMHPSENKIDLYKCNICNNVSTSEDLVQEHVTSCHDKTDQTCVSLWTTLAVNYSSEKKDTVLFKLAPSANKDPIKVEDEPCASPVKRGSKRGRPSKANKTPPTRKSVRLTATETKAPETIQTSAVDIDDGSKEDSKSGVAFPEFVHPDAEKESEEEAQEEDKYSDEALSSSSGSICMSDISLPLVKNVEELCSNRMFINYIKEKITTRYEAQGIVPTDDRIEKRIKKFIAYMMGQINASNEQPNAPAASVRGRGRGRGRVVRRGRPRK